MAGGSFGGGSGTELDPYLVEDADDLNAVRSNLNKYFLQTADIDLSSYANWDPIDSFVGLYDGDNYIIDNLTIDRSTTDNVGLFGYLTAAHTLKNIILTNVDVVGQDETGALVGHARFTTIQNCHSDGTVTGREHVGGLIGYIATNTTADPINDVYRCTAKGTVIGKIIGGFVGRVFHTNLKQCKADVDVRINTHYGAGGAFAYYINNDVSTTIVEECCAKGSVINTPDITPAGDFKYNCSVSGFTVYSRGDFLNSYTTAYMNCWEIDGYTDSFIAGFIAYPLSGSDEIRNCYVSGQMTTNVSYYDQYRFIGTYREPTLRLCYYNAELTVGRDYSAALGLSDDGMLSYAHETYYLNGDTAWAPYCSDNDYYPMLRWEGRLKKYNSTTKMWDAVYFKKYISSQWTERPLKKYIDSKWLA